MTAFKVWSGYVEKVSKVWVILITELISLQITSISEYWYTWYYVYLTTMWYYVLWSVQILKNTVMIFI